MIAIDSWNDVDRYGGLVTHGHKLHMESGLGKPNQFLIWDASETGFPWHVMGCWDCCNGRTMDRVTQDKMVCVMWPPMAQRHAEISRKKYDGFAGTPPQHTLPEHRAFGPEMGQKQ